MKPAKTTPALWETIKKELLTSKLFFIAMPFALLYALFTLYLFNYRLLIETWGGNFPLTYKFAVMIALLQGFHTLFTPFDLTLLIVMALLVGINCMVTFSTIRRIKQQGNVTLSIGGASVIGLATAGCSTCGISLFALFGLSSAVSSLPFHGLELHSIAFVLLLGSLVYMIRKLHEEIYCKITNSGV